MHLLDLAGGNDEVRIKDVAGPFIVHGKAGQDSVKVTSDEFKLDKIQALLASDGGQEDGANDALVMDNSGDQSLDDVLLVTRSLVEVPSMEFAQPPGSAPAFSYLLNLRGATGGKFKVLLTEPGASEPKNVTVEYPVSSAVFESKLQRALIPKDEELDSCGSQGVAKCSNAVKVWQVGDGFAVFFVGERLDSDIGMQLITEELENFESELFQNKPNDLLRRNSDLVYANVEQLYIAMGNQSVVVNVRGKNTQLNM
jgi:hypothetical protein